MKKHYYFQGKEVKEGDLSKFSLNINGVETGAAGLVDTADLEMLAKAGFIDVVELSDDKDVPTKSDWYLHKLEQRLETTFSSLISIYKFSKNAFSSLLLKEVSIMLDNKYPGHIKNSNKWFVINSNTKEIIPLNPKEENDKDNFVKTYAVFRTVYDALFALNVLEHFEDKFNELSVEENTCKCENQKCCS